MSVSAWGMIATVTGLAAASAVLSGRRRMRRAAAAAGVDLRPVSAPPRDGGVPGGVIGGLPGGAAQDPHVGAVYFGAPWDVPALDGATQAPTPAGQPCATCGEPIAAGDRGWLRPALRAEHGRTVAAVAAQHRECELLAIVGHEYGVCECHGYDVSRGSALELWLRIHEQHPARGGCDV